MRRVQSSLNSNEASSHINLCTVTVDCFHCRPVLLSGNQAEVLVDASNTENTDTAVCLDIPQPVLDAVIMEILRHGLLHQIERQATAIEILAAAPPGETADQRGTRVDQMLRSRYTVPSLWRSFLRQVVDDADNSKWAQKAGFLQVLRHEVPTQINPQFVLLADHAIGRVPDDADFIGEIQPWKDPAVARAEIRAKRQAAADAMDTAESEIDLTAMGAADAASTADAEVKQSPSRAPRRADPRRRRRRKRRGRAHTRRLKKARRRTSPPPPSSCPPTWILPPVWRRRPSSGRRRSRTG